MYRTFQQSYVDDNKTFCNKYICTRKERMNLLIKRETRNKKLEYIERSFMCYETETESDENSITSFSITCCRLPNKTEIPYLTEGHHSYINTAALTSDHNLHCTLVALHKTVGSAANRLFHFVMNQVWCFRS
jgi:hypothetical protein